MYETTEIGLEGSEWLSRHSRRDELFAVAHETERRKIKENEIIANLELSIFDLKYVIFVIGNVKKAGIFIG